jgi:hypothetical protein
MVTSLVKRRRDTAGGVQELAVPFGRSLFILSLFSLSIHCSCVFSPFPFLLGSCAFPHSPSSRFLTASYSVLLSAPFPDHVFASFSIFALSSSLVLLKSQEYGSDLYAQHNIELLDDVLSGISILYIYTVPMQICREEFSMRKNFPRKILPCTTNV